MNPKNVKPKLHFEVGEKVVICACVIKFSGYGTYNYPDENDFTFTTIKEVNDDGTVTVEEGYVYRQSYETQFGETYLHDWFRIKTQPKQGTRFSKRYSAERESERVFENYDFSVPTVLLKYNETWEEKRKMVEKRWAERQAKQEAENRAHDEKNAREKPFRDAYKAEIEPLEDALIKAKIKAWKEHLCANCKHNHDGHCCKWDEDIATHDTTCCSAFEV